MRNILPLLAMVQVLYAQQISQTPIRIMNDFRDNSLFDWMPVGTRTWTEQGGAIYANTGNSDAFLLRPETFSGNGVLVLRIGDAVNAASNREGLVLNYQNSTTFSTISFKLGTGFTNHVRYCKDRYSSCQIITIPTQTNNQDLRLEFTDGKIHFWTGNATGYLGSVTHSLSHTMGFFSRASTSGTSFSHFSWNSDENAIGQQIRIFHRQSNGDQTAPLQVARGKGFTHAYYEITHWGPWMRNSSPLQCRNQPIQNCQDLIHAISNELLVFQAAGVIPIPSITSASAHSIYWHDWAAARGISLQSNTLTLNQNTPLHSLTDPNFALLFRELLQAVRQAYTNSGIAIPQLIFLNGDEQASESAPHRYVSGNDWHCYKPVLGRSSTRDRLAVLSAMNTGLSLEEAVKKVLIDYWHSRVVDVSNVFPNATALLWGDMFDPATNGGHYYSYGDGNCTSNWVQLATGSSYDILRLRYLTPTQQSFFKQKVVVVPWSYGGFHDVWLDPEWARHRTPNVSYGRLNIVTKEFIPMQSVDYFERLGFKVMAGMGITHTDTLSYCGVKRGWDNTESPPVLRCLAVNQPVVLAHINSWMTASRFSHRKSVVGYVATQWVVPAFGTDWGGGPNNGMPDHVLHRIDDWLIANGHLQWPITNRANRFMIFPN